MYDLKNQCTTEIIFSPHYCVNSGSGNGLSHVEEERSENEEYYDGLNSYK